MLQPTNLSGEFGQIGLTHYDSLWHDLVSAVPKENLTYFTLHKQRYLELFNAMGHYLDRKSQPVVLEVGVSGFLPLYKKLFPEMRLVTIDRPVDLNGANEDYCCTVCGAERYYGIDLNTHFLTSDFGVPALGKFDYVICTEVIEHLTVNPIEFIGSLMSVLKPDGHLYLTTPNFFSWGHLQQIYRRENPQSIFPKRGDNWDCHHHFREYTLKELAEFSKAAGARIVAAQYSDCWDDADLHTRVLAESPDQSSNLVLVATPRGTSTAKDVDLVAPKLQMEGAATQELEHLRRLVQGYESGKFIRLMKWLKRVTT